MKHTLVAIIAGLSVTTAAFSQSQPESSGSADRAAQAYYQFARAHLLEAEGDWEGALEAYQEALALDPTDSSIYSEIAESYAERNFWQDAIDYAGRALNADPDNLDAHRLLSRIYTGLLSNSRGQEISEEWVRLAIEELEHVVRLSPEETEAYLTLGRLYRFTGQPERAEEVYRDFVQIEPSSEEGAIALAELQMGAGNAREAIELLEDFIENQPDADTALMVLGQAYVEINELDQAAEVFERAIDLGRDEIELLQELARVLFVSRRFDEAAERYEEIVDRQPEDAVAWLRLGQIERERMNYAASRRYLERANAIVPGSTDIIFAMAMLNRDEGRFEAAIANLRDLLDQSQPTNGRYTAGERENRRLFLTHVAVLHTLLEQYEEAVAAFEEMKAVVRNRDGTIDSYIVDTYRSARQLDRALEKAESSLRVFPDNRQLRLQQADLLGQLGRVDEGMTLLTGMLDDTDADYEVLSTMVGLHENAEDWVSAEALLQDMVVRFEDRQEESYFLLGAVYERQERDRDAEEAFRQALEINADNPAVLNYLGYMLADNGDRLEEALELIQKAVDADPLNGAYLDSLGWVYYRLDRLDLAEQYLERAILFSSTDPTLHEHLGDLYRRTGRIAEAREAYQRSLELADDAKERDAVLEKLDQLRSEI